MNIRECGGLAPWVVLLTLGVAGCSNAVGSETDAAGDDAAVVVPGDGSAPARISLSSRAEQRLGIQTEPIAAASSRAGSSSKLVMPYSAIVYDADGRAWAFTSTGPRTYRRAPLGVLTVHDDVVTLRSGPPAGTEVVTVGAAELVGMEAGISGEE
jgi:hypothetical protein